MEVYLEKVYSEYLDVKDYVKKSLKTIEELKNDVVEALKAETTPEQAEDIYFEKMEKNIMHQTDLMNQQTRLFYTVEAYKDYMEIPQEIKKEVEKLKFIQTFAIKNGKAEILDHDSYNFTRQQIKNALSEGVDTFKKRHL